MEPPMNPKDYLHWVGWTARAGKGGIAINFVSQYDIQNFIKIEKYIDMKM